MKTQEKTESVLIHLLSIMKGKRHAHVVVEFLPVEEQKVQAIKILNNYFF